MKTTSLTGRKPGRLDLVAVQGDDVGVIAEVFDQDDEPIDVTGWTLESQVRATYDGDLLLTFTVETAADDPGLDDNEVRLSASAAQMEAVGEGAWPWDLRRTSGGPSVRTLLAGTLLVRPRVTED